MSSDDGVSAFPEEDNLFKWIGTIEGPTDTVGTYYIICCLQCTTMVVCRHFASFRNK